jgi:hypothetical protein
MTDVRLQSALARLAPQVDDVARWDDVVRRAQVEPRIRWRLAVVAVALLVTAGVVVGGLAAGLFGGSLDRLSAWVGDQPGELAPEQQAAFDQENSLAYAKFPKGTRIGRLVQVEFNGRKYELLGFRDGANLCLRVVPSPLSRAQNPPECVPPRELLRLGAPVAAVGGHLRARMRDGSGLTMLYGLASDAVSSVEVIEKGRPLGQAAVGNNAFLFVVADHPRYPSGGPPIVLRASDDRDVIADIPLETGPIVPDVDDPTALPGPDGVKPALTNGSIGWLDRGEPRGEPFKFPGHGPMRIVEARLLEPDPATSFRVGVARSEGTDWRTAGRWYCLAWFWPLIRGSSMSMCSRDDPIETGLFYSASLMSSAVQFPLWVGLAADEVAGLELYHRDGSVDAVSLVDNVFSFHTLRGEATKLVAYDKNDRVVRIEVVGGPGSGAVGWSMAP